MYVYFYSRHVSGSHVPIIGIINCINMKSGVCRSAKMIVWCAGYLHIRRSSMQSHIYQMSYWYN